MTARIRQLFRSSQAEVWRQLSAEIGGTYAQGWRGRKVQASHGEWTITLDTVNAKVALTRMRAPYVNPEGFRFTIYRKSVFSGLAVALGMQDIRIGDPSFDEAFVIKGTHESRVHALLADVTIRRLIDAQPQIHLSVKDDEGWFGAEFPEGVDELHFLAPGIITDLERLRQLYDLFAAVLDRLCAIGSAYERDPRVTL